MPKFKIPFEWTVAGEVEVEAEDLTKALLEVDERPLEQLEAEYVDGSFTVYKDLLQELNPGVDVGDIRPAAQNIVSE